MIGFWGFRIFGFFEDFRKYFDSLSVVKMKKCRRRQNDEKLQKTWDCAGGRFQDFQEDDFIKIHEKKCC